MVAKAFSNMVMLKPYNPAWFSSSLKTTKNRNFKQQFQASLRNNRSLSNLYIRNGMQVKMYLMGIRVSTKTLGDSSQMDTLPR